MDSDRQQRQTSTELRTQVEAAKLLYKAEKERYRQNREERRKEKTRRMLELMGDMSLERAQAITNETGAIQPAPVDPTPNPEPRRRSMRAGPPNDIYGTSGRAAHIVSNARGSFPQFEMIGVDSSTGPRRSHTLPVHGRGHHGPHGRRHTDSDDPATRAVKRINRKLADMGFSETAHPDLASKIRANIPEDGIMTRDKEDDIVTSLLEELVIRTKSPAGPVASSSRK
jgi:Wiskott-Aldrich syndrome protein